MTRPPRLALLLSGSSTCIAEVFCAVSLDQEGDGRIVEVPLPSPPEP
jgi:hypothetical protein